MAVFPKRFDKGSRVEDYVGYMVDRIEYWAQISDKKVIELGKKNAELTEENKALKAKLDAIEGELNEMKINIVSGGKDGNV
jgi:hypothetical protein